jgi:hypothetical protein
MLAIPAPAMLPTNLRRDIANRPSPERYKRDTVCFYCWVIYPMEGVNDQVITTLRTWLRRIFS